jgi:hypothetical protein
MQGDPAKMAEARKAESETPYQRWMAGVAERKQLRDMIVALLAPAQAESRKKMEADERATTEQLKAGESRYKAGIGEELGLMAKQVEGMRARIASMSLSERSIPAWLARAASQDAFPFVAPNSEQAVRVLQFDSEPFRMRRSRVEARSIWVRLSASLTCQHRQFTARCSRLSINSTGRRWLGWSNRENAG